MKNILFTPNEDGFGPSALTSYIVKQLSATKPDWHVTIWNKSRCFYNKLLYAEQIKQKRISVKPISNIIELVKEDGRIALDKTLNSLQDYKNLSNNYQGIKDFPEFDLVVDFGVPAAAKWAVKNKMKSLSVFDHCWSKTLDLIYKDDDKSNVNNILNINNEWQKLIQGIRNDESYIQSMFLFPEFITPPVFYNHWKQFLRTPIQELKGVFGGAGGANKEQIKNSFGFFDDGITVFIQGGDTLAWDYLLENLLPQLAAEDENKLESEKINILVYVPERIKKNNEINNILNQNLNRVKDFQPLKGGTIQAILPAVDFMITRAGGGTVNDAVARRVPFACVEEPSHSQVQLILEECLNHGLTREIKYEDFMNNPLEIILYQSKQTAHNNKIVEQMKTIPNQQEDVVVNKIIEMVEG